VEVRKVSTTYSDEIAKSLESVREEQEDNKSKMDKIMFEYYQKYA